MLAKPRNHLIGGFLLDLSGHIMKAFILNFAKVVEHNAKIYASIIVGLVACLLLLVGEAVHVQVLVESMTGQSHQAISQAVEPLTLRYSLSRYVVMILAIVWSVLEYKKTKKKFGL